MDHRGLRGVHAGLFGYGGQIGSQLKASVHGKIASQRGSGDREKCR